jgi:hypothetical protein
MKMEAIRITYKTPPWVLNNIPLRVVMTPFGCKQVVCQTILFGGLGIMKLCTRPVVPDLDVSI